MQLILFHLGNKILNSGENPKRRKTAGRSESDVNFDMSDSEENVEDFKDCEKGTGK